MAASETLEYLVKVNDRDLKELKRNIDSANKGLDQDLGRSATAAEGHLGKVHAATKLLALATGGALVEGLKKSYDAAIEAQRAQQGTVVQLRALHISYSEHRKDIEETIKRTSELSAFEQKDLQQSFTRLLPATHNVNKALQEMGIASNIARARHISLESATNLVTRANTGSAGALRRLGITLVATHANLEQARADMAAYKKSHTDLSPAMTKHFQDEMANAKAADLHAQAIKNVTTLQQTFAGAAQTYGSSAAGAQDRFKNSINEVEIALGQGLLPMITAVLNEGAKLLTWTTHHAAETKIAIGVVVALGAALLVAKTVMFALESATTVQTAATKLWTGAQWLLNAALDANPIALAVIAIAALTAAVIIAYKHSQTFRDIVHEAFRVVDNVIDHTRSVAAALWHGFEDTLSWVRGHWPIIATIISGPFAPLVALATNAFGVRSALENAFQAIWGKVKSVTDDIGAFFTGLPKRLAGPVDKIHDAIKIVSDIAGTLGHAIDKVIDGFKWVINNAKRIGDLFGSIGGGISNLAGKLNPFGDGLAGIQRAGVAPAGGGNVPIPAGVRFDPNVSHGLYDDIALGMSYGLHESSGYRPGAITSTGNVSLHSVFPARAVDMAGSEGGMRAFFLREIGRPGIQELIHSPYWWHPGSGVQFIPSSAGTVLRDHYSHVHVGIYDQGGELPPGLTLALNLTGRPERVVSPQEHSGPLVYIAEMHLHNEADVEKVGSAVQRAWGVRR